MGFLSAWSPEGNKIAFLSNRTNPDWLELWVMDADGSNQTRLTASVLSGINQTGGPYPPLPWSLPSWNPDGTKIAFSGWLWGYNSYDIWIINADGTGLQQLTEHEMYDVSVAWSPDGTKIAFQSFRSNNWDIWVVKTDGSNPMQLTENAGENIQPSWSPDGDMIAFISNRTGAIELWVMDADGENQKQLADMPSWTETYYPSWSPDGDKIVFASTLSGKWDIWVVTLSYPPGEITSLDIPNEMIKNWNYSISIVVENDEGISHNFTTKLTGNGFSVSPLERSIVVSAHDNSTLEFSVTPQEEGNKTLTVLLLQGLKELDRRSHVVNVKLPAILRCAPANVGAKGNPGESYERAITIINDNIISAVDIEIIKSGRVSGWISVTPRFIESIVQDQNVEITLDIDIPAGTSPGNHTGSLTITGANFANIEIPITIEVIHPGLDPTLITVAIIGLVATIVGALIAGYYRAKGRTPEKESEKPRKVKRRKR